MKWNCPFLWGLEFYAIQMNNQKRLFIFQNVESKIKNFNTHVFTYFSTDKGSYFEKKPGFLV